MPPPPVERSNTVTVRLTEDEHAKLVALAEVDGLSQSDVLRQLLRARVLPARPAGRTKVKLGTPSGIDRIRLDDYTVVHDLSANRPIFQIAGIVPVPIGTEIELTDPNLNARVTRIRLLAGNPTTLCLDVVLPER